MIWYIIESVELIKSYNFYVHSSRFILSYAFKVDLFLFFNLFKCCSSNLYLQVFFTHLKTICIKSTLILFKYNILEHCLQILAMKILQPLLEKKIRLMQYVAIYQITLPFNLTFMACLVHGNSSSIPIEFYGSCNSYVWLEEIVIRRNYNSLSS